MTDPRYPALAEVADVELRVERTFSGTEADRIDALLNSVSIKVRRASGRLWLALDSDGNIAVPHTLDPAMPETVWDITVTAVERAVRNPDGYSSESSGDYSYQRVGIPGGVGGVYLTDEEKETLRKYRPGTTGMWTQSTTRGEHEATGDTYWLADSFGHGFPMTDELDGRLS